MIDSSTTTSQAPKKTVESRPPASGEAATTTNTSTVTESEREVTKPSEGISRRAALASVGLLATGGLSGCLGALGAEPVTPEKTTTTPSRTTTPDSEVGMGESDVEHDHGPERDYDQEGRQDGTPTPDVGETRTPRSSGPASLVGPGVLPADVQPEPGRGRGDQWEHPGYRAYLGPLTSANHGIQDVTVTNTPHADRENSPLRAYLDADYLDEPIIESDGSFTITGAMHYTHECGYYGINYLDATDGEATLALAYTIDETTCTPEYAGRLGARYGPITITGKLDPSLDVRSITVSFLSGVHVYDLEDSGGVPGGPWDSVANWHFHP